MTHHDTFAAQHVPGDPIVLFNIWDAGSAATLTKAGASALATGSWGVAAAQGYRDGESLPLDSLLHTIARIKAVSDLPLSVDIEGGYAVDPAGVAATVTAVQEAGAIGINFEDRIVGGKGLHPVDVHAARIAAARHAAGAAFFINARCDIFFDGSDTDTQRNNMDQALARASAYKDAGASGLFVPGLNDPDLVKTLCRDSPLPVNVMLADPADIAPMANCGVARISFGPNPYIAAMQHLTQAFKALSATSKNTT